MSLKGSVVVFLSLASLPLLTDSNSIPFQIKQDTMTAKEGSCITLECVSTGSMKRGSVDWFWMKNPFHDKSLSRFIGTVVSSNMQDRPAAPEFVGRTDYTGLAGSVTSSFCSLRISHLQKNDSGTYIFRYFIGGDKWRSNPLKLEVEDNLCPVRMETETVQEFVLVSVQCSTSKLCASYPEITGLHMGVKQDHKDEADRKTTTLSFRASWRDDGRVLSCQPPAMEKEDQCLSKTVTLTVEFAPKETKASVSSADVTVGDDLSLTCSSRARPNATFSWFKDRQPAFHSGAQWRIRSINATDSGQYRCQAVNKLGSDNALVTVNVKYAPVGVSIDADNGKSTILKGDDVTLVCSVERSNPAVTWYEWYQDGARKWQETSKQLQIKSINPQHRGEYTCKATNRVGPTTSPVYQLDVNYAPQNTKISSSGGSRVKEGSSLVFSCETESYPPPTNYSWYHRDTREWVESPSVRLQSSDQNLPLDLLGAADTGCYLCSATNNIGTGENSSSLCINVLYGPATPVLTVVGVVREGYLVTLTCTVQSFPPSHITLTSTSRSHLLPAPHPRVTSGPVERSIQTSFNVTLSHAGTYTCLAQNSEGHNSVQKELNVTYSPKNVTVLVQPSADLLEYNHLVLACTGRSNPGVSSYTWTRTTAETEQIVGGGQRLNIESLTPAHTGLYSCMARNELGTGRSDPVDIKVMYAPKHTEILRNMDSGGQSDKHSPVTLTCSSHSYPLVHTYRWYKLTEDKGDKGDKGECVAENQNITVHPDEPGTYYCVAENAIDSKESDRVQLFLDRGFRHFLPLLLLLVCVPFIILLIFQVRRHRRQGTSETVSSCDPFSLLGRGNGTTDNLMGDGRRSRDELVSVPGPLSLSQPARACPDFTSASNVHTVYSALKMPTRKQVHSPGQPIRASAEPSQSDAVNYATVNFMSRDTTNHACGSRVAGLEEDFYTKVIKPQPKEKDYENIKGVCHPRRPMETDSETSEEDVELHYSQVTFKTKAGHHHHHNYSSPDEEDYKTQYSKVRI